MAIKRWLRSLAVTAGVSCIPQYAWEAWQSPIFYMGSPGVGILFGATLVAVMMEIGLYVLLSLVNQDVGWVAKKYNAKDYTIMVLYALFYS